MNFKTQLREAAQHTWNRTDSSPGLEGRGLWPPSPREEQKWIPFSRLFFLKAARLEGELEEEGHMRLRQQRKRKTVRNSKTKNKKFEQKNDFPHMKKKKKGKLTYRENDLRPANTKEQLWYSCSLPRDGNATVKTVPLDGGLFIEEMCFLKHRSQKQAICLSQGSFNDISIPLSSQGCSTTGQPLKCKETYSSQI